MDSYYLLLFIIMYYLSDGIYLTTRLQLTLLITDIVIYPIKHKTVVIIEYKIFLFILNVSSNFNTSINAKGRNMTKKRNTSINCGK